MQGFSYEHTDGKNKEKLNSDFTPLPAILEGSSSDCDSRSLLVSVLLNQAGIPSKMIFSPEYLHAMATVKNNAPGQTYKDPKTGEDYLMGETTEKVTWGMIAKDFSDRTKWFTIDALEE